MKYLLYTLIVTALLISACKKEESGDGTKPVIVVKGFNPVYWAEGIPYVDMGAEAYDISATGDTTDLTSAIITQNNVDISIAGDYRVTYNVTDESGLKADEQERIVKVVLGK